LFTSTPEPAKAIHDGLDERGQPIDVDEVALRRHRRLRPVRVQFRDERFGLAPRLTVVDDDARAGFMQLARDRGAEPPRSPRDQRAAPGQRLRLFHRSTPRSASSLPATILDTASAVAVREITQ
jgi:hypothetical protein